MWSIKDLLTHDVKSAEAQVRRTGKVVIETVTRVVNGLEHDNPLNSLGELQQYGSMFDAAVSRLHTLRKVLEIIEDEEKEITP